MHLFPSQRLGSRFNPLHRGPTPWARQQAWSPPQQRLPTLRLEGVASLGGFEVKISTPKKRCVFFVVGGWKFFLSFLGSSVFFCFWKWKGRLLSTSGISAFDENFDQFSLYEVIDVFLGLIPLLLWSFPEMLEKQVRWCLFCFLSSYVLTCIYSKLFKHVNMPDKTESAPQSLDISPLCSDFNYDHSSVFSLIILGVRVFFSTWQCSFLYLHFHSICWSRYFL